MSRWIEKHEKQMKELAEVVNNRMSGMPEVKSGQNEDEAESNLNQSESFLYNIKCKGVDKKRYLVYS